MSIVRQKIAAAQALLGEALALMAMPEPAPQVAEPIAPDTQPAAEAPIAIEPPAAAPEVPPAAETATQPAIEPVVTDQPTPPAEPVAETPPVELAPTPTPQEPPVQEPTPAAPDMPTPEAPAAEAPPVSAPAAESINVTVPAPLEPAGDRTAETRARLKTDVAIIAQRLLEQARVGERSTDPSMQAASSTWIDGITAMESAYVARIDAAASLDELQAINPTADWPVPPGGAG